MRPGGGADGIGEDILAWLARASGPAFVVSPQDAVLLATNPAGAKALGFETEFDGAMPLDSAMPAIMDLRRAANRGMQAETGQPMPLVFWTPDGVARLVCLVRWSGEPGPQRRALIAVTLPGKTQDGSPDAAISTAARSAVTTTQTLAPEQQRGVAASPMPIMPPAAAAISEAIERREEPSAAPRYSSMPKQPSERAPARTVAAAAQPLPAVTAAPLAPPPNSPPRSDEETLKAIARQILAGRQALAQSGSDVGPTIPVALPREEPNAAAQKPPHARTSPSETDPRAPAEHGDSQPHPRKPPVPPPVSREAKKPAASPISTAPAAPSSEAPRIAAPRAMAAPAGKNTASEPQSTERHNVLRRIAHELKTPVGAIASAAEIMKDERFGAIGDARYLRYARDIHASAHHALQVIERMLGRRASDQSNLPELAFTDLELNALLSEVVSSLEIVAIEAGITLKSELSTRLPRVVADATSVRQILINTLTNALKFSPRGSTVTVCSHATPAGPLMITVADNGPGMPSDEIAHIVAHATDSTGGEEQERPGGGFGIGLPLSMKLASANGATLAIESKLGDGTRVTLAFPGNRLVPV